MGIALLGSMATLFYRSTLGATMPTGLPRSVVETAMRGIGDATTLSGTVPGASALMTAVRAAYTGATEIAFFVAAGLMILSAAGAMLIFGRKGRAR